MNIYTTLSMSITFHSSDDKLWFRALWHGREALRPLDVVDQLFLFRFHPRRPDTKSRLVQHPHLVLLAATTTATTTTVTTLVAIAAAAVAACFGKRSRRRALLFGTATIATI